MSQFVYIPESEIWTDKVRMIQTKDPVLGGKDGPANWAPQDLTNRTIFLKKAVETAQASANAASTSAKNADTKAGTAQTTANQAKTAAANAQKTADDAKSAAATADGKAVAAQASANAASTAAKNADTKAGTAQTTANQAKTAAATAQTAADDAKSAAATADGKAVAAQTSANAASTAAKNADTKAGTAQTTANQAKTAAANAQKTADEAETAAATANTAAKNADTKATNADKKAGTAQTTANGAKTAADNAQTKANQVPNPLLDQLPIGASGTAYKLITIADLKSKLGVPAATQIVQITGTSTTAAMSQKAVSDLVTTGDGARYQRINKTLIQRGFSHTADTKEIKFPISFSNNDVIVLPILNKEPGNSDTIAIISRNKTGFTAKGKIQNGSSLSATFDWVAFGE